MGSGSVANHGNPPNPGLKVQTNLRPGRRGSGRDDHRCLKLLAVDLRQLLARLQVARRRATAGGRAGGSGSGRRGRRPPAAGCARRWRAGSWPCAAEALDHGTALAVADPQRLRRRSARPVQAASYAGRSQAPGAPPQCAKGRVVLPGVGHGQDLVRREAVEVLLVAGRRRSVKETSTGGSQTLGSARPWDRASARTGSSQPSVASDAPTRERRAVLRVVAL